MTEIQYRTSTLGPAHDHRTRLLVMGILLMMVGGLCALTVLGIVAAMMLAPRGVMPSSSTKQLVTGMVIYVGVAAVFTTLGIGSILRKRWSRPVVLGIAWPWLMIGICATVMVFYASEQMVRVTATGTLSPPTTAPALPTTADVGYFMLIGAAIASIFYVGIPLALILAYKSPSVQSTLEFYDPHARWTDGVPIRIMGLMFLLSVTAISLLANSFSAVAPAFGILLAGPVAVIVLIVIAALFALAAWWTYRRQMRGWVLALVLFILMPISAAITFSRVSMRDMYKAMGMSDRDIQMIAQVNGMRPGQIMVWVIFGGVIGIGYVLFARSSFIAPEALREPPLAQTAHREETA